jgi:hypothetical protein
MIGTQWQPGRDMQMNGRPQPRPTPTTPARLLSLRLPNRQGQSSIAPQQLLQGQGSQGVGDGNLSNFLTLLGHILNNPQNAGGGFASAGGVGGGGKQDVGQYGGPADGRRLTPGLQPPGSAPMPRNPPSVSQMLFSGGGFQPQDALGEDRDPIGGHGTMHVNAPGYQVPGVGPSQGPQPNKIPTPKFTIGNGAPAFDPQRIEGPGGYAPPFF